MKSRIRIFTLVLATGALAACALPDDDNRISKYTEENGQAYYHLADAIESGSLIDEALPSNYDTTQTVVSGISFRFNEWDSQAAPVDRPKVVRPMMEQVCAHLGYRDALSDFDRVVIDNPAGAHSPVQGDAITYVGQCEPKADG